MNEIDQLIKEHEQLKQEHANIENEINKISEAQGSQFEIQKLKKRKLWLKDRILYIESVIYPDIIA